MHHDLSRPNSRNHKTQEEDGGFGSDAADHPGPRLDAYTLVTRPWSHPHGCDGFVTYGLTRSIKSDVCSCRWNQIKERVDVIKSQNVRTPIHNVNFNAFTSLCNINVKLWWPRKKKITQRCYWGDSIQLYRSKIVDIQKILTVVGFILHIAGHCNRAPLTCHWTDHLCSSWQEPNPS